jgi:hypothetical protein
MQKRINRNLALLIMIAFLAFPSYSDGSPMAQKKAKAFQASKNAGKLIELDSIKQLKATFQRDAGKVRLVTILSPT